MKTAQFVKDVGSFTGSASLYKLSDPVEYGFDDHRNTTEFVIVSATVALYSGPETYIFPATESGEIADWGELEGSYRGGLCHETALEAAGFTVKGRE